MGSPREDRGPRTDAVRRTEHTTGTNEGSYLPCCVASVCRLRATSAQASTAPCRVCRSGLCVIDSRRGNTAKHTVGEARGDCQTRVQDPGEERTRSVLSSSHSQGETEASNTLNSMGRHVNREGECDLRGYLFQTAHISGAPDTGWGLRVRTDIREEGEQTVFQVFLIVQGPLGGRRTEAGL